MVERRGVPCEYAPGSVDKKNKVCVLLLCSAQPSLTVTTFSVRLMLAHLKKIPCLKKLNFHD